MKIYSKQQYKDEARESLLRGSEAVYNAVAPTLGAKGRTIVLWKPEETKAIQDGVNIARRINPEDPFENAGAEIIKQAAHRQVSSVGDGTTVTVVLAHTLAKEAHKVVTNGVNPVLVKEALEKGRGILLKEIEKLSTPVTEESQMVNIATISAKEKHLGETIGKLYAKHGKSTVIVPEKGGFETTVEHQDGVRLDAGFAHPYFVTNIQTRMANLSETYTLVLDYQLSEVMSLVELFKQVQQSGKGITIFLKEIDADPLAVLIQNKIQKGFKVNVIKVPSFKSRENLEDIALATGAKLISQEAGMALKDVTIEDLGFATSIQSTERTTVIIDGAADQKLMKARIKQLKKQEEEADSEFESEKFRERHAKLTGGVYVLRVGGSSEVELEERKERADDAIRAVYSSLERGIVPGGEITYLNILDALKAESEAEEFAYRILKNTLTKPFNILMENAGLDAGKMLERLNTIDQKTYGIDVKDNQIKDMIQAGIVDPAKALEEAIKNSISVAGQIITSEGIVAEFVEVNDAK